MNSLSRIQSELEPLDRARVPNIASAENFAFLSVLDKSWPTIRGMISIALAGRLLPSQKVSRVRGAWLVLIGRADAIVL